MSTDGTNENAKPKTAAEWVETVAEEIRAVVAENESRESHYGRPGKLSEPILRAILEDIANGTPKSTAAVAAGITRRTWANWTEGSEALEKLQDAAESFSVTSMVAEIREGTDIKGNADWKARAWLLERRQKGDFAPPRNVETSVTINNNSVSVFSNPEAQSLAQSMHEQAIAMMLEQRANCRALPDVGPLEAA